MNILYGHFGVILSFTPNVSTLACESIFVVRFGLNMEHD